MSYRGIGQDEHYSEGDYCTHADHFGRNEGLASLVVMRVGIVCQAERA